MFVFPQGATSKIIPLAIKDSASTTGGYKTGLVAANFLISYSRADQGNNDATVVTLSPGTRGTWSSGGIVEKDATNSKGNYEFGLPNGALAAGSDWCVVTVQDVDGSHGIAAQQILIMLADAAKGLAAPSNLDATISGIKSDTAAILTDVNTGAGAIYDRLGAPVGASLAADIAATKATLASGVALTAVERNATADALLDRANGVEANWTLRQVLRIIFSVLAGKTTGGGLNFRDAADTKNRLVVAVDGSSNRTITSRDAT